MTPWTKLSVEERLTILTNIADEKGIVENAVEKDYWVSMVLRSIFSLPYSDGSTFYQNNVLSDLDRAWLNYFYLPYIARSDVYRELDDIVYDGNNNVLTDAQRLELQAALNNGNPTPPSGGRIPNVH